MEMDFETYNQLLDIQRINTDIIILIREQNISSATIMLVKLTQHIGRTINGIKQGDLLHRLETLSELMERRDYEGLADYVETELITYLGRILIETWITNKLLYEIKIKEMNLSSGICQFPMENKDFSSITVKPSLVGANIPLYNEQEYHFCTENNPYSEGRLWAERNYEPLINEYIVMGLGFAYHVEALCNKCLFQKITVFEGNIEVINALLRSRILENLWTYQNVKIIFDPNYRLLFEALKECCDQTYMKFAVNMPSLQLISNIKIRQAIENYIHTVDNIKNAENELKRNFYYNTSSIQDSVWKICDKVKGKDIIIIGAGPSIETQYDEICFLMRKENPPVIIAVGAIALRLVEKGINPSYITFSDSSEMIKWQYQGLVNAKIPVIVLSTAFMGISEYFLKNKYIALQENYKLACDMAKREKIISFSTGGSVLTFSLDMMIKFQAKEIILAGVDLSYIEGKSHAEIDTKCNFSDMNNLSKVETNDGGYAYAPQNFIGFKEWIENRIIQEDSRDIKFYNTSEKGAKITGIPYRSISSVAQELD